MFDELLFKKDMLKSLNESTSPDGNFKFEESNSKSKTGMSWIDMLYEMESLGYDYTGDYSFIPKGYKQKKNLYRFDYNNKPGTKELSSDDLEKRFDGRATVFLSGSEYAPEMKKILMTNKLFNDTSVNESYGPECEDIVVKICTCNDSFQDGNRYQELANIFHEIADKIENGMGCNFKIKDINGNVIGSIEDNE